MPRKRAQRRVCFVTGTRAEFGLMVSTLRAIEAHPNLQLQVIATGMHLDRSRGKSVADIRAAGFRVDATVPWTARHDPISTSINTGRAMARMGALFEMLKTDIVLVVGDRVEPFAAASAAHISGRIVAHVHGGDRALGQVDDALRHAITKLAHVHFPATMQSAHRVRKLGEDLWRIHRVGTPGLDAIREAASRTTRERDFALIVLHPTDSSSRMETTRAKLLLQVLRSSAIPRFEVVYPNNDPGSAGIARCWDGLTRDPRFTIHRNLPRADYLGLLRDTAMLIGNSSSGIIEAASFGTPVIDIGPRQAGRERGANVTHVPFVAEQISAAMRKLWNHGRPRRFVGRTVYSGGGAGQRIADVLATIPLDDRLRRKLIAY